jgi:hypothetical protein
MIDREHAEMLALGGINLAMAQLSMQVKTPKKEIKKKLSKAELKKKRKKEMSQMLNRTLPNLNRWQEYKLVKDVDGMDGIVKICVTCENGKININEVFDFKKQAFKPKYKNLLLKLKLVSEGKKVDPEQFLKRLTEFLKKRKRKLDDISELREEKILKTAKLFYEPPIRTEKIREAKPNKEVTLQDIFTIWSENEKLEALFLSDALCSMLNFRRPGAYDSQIRKEKFQEVIKKFEPNLDQNDEKYWKIVSPLYEPKSTTRMKDIKIFSSKFEPTVYSVLCSGKVGNVEQRLLAVIKKVKKQKTKKEQDKKNKKDKVKKDKEKKVEREKSFNVIRLYWM